MRMNFVKGMLIGGLAAAIAGMVYYPQMRPASRKTLVGKTKRLRKQTGRMMRDMAHEMGEFIRK